MSVKVKELVRFLNRFDRNDDAMLFTDMEGNPELIVVTMQEPDGITVMRGE